MILITSAVAAAPYTLAGIVGLCGMLVGFYIIFICEKNAGELMAFGFGTSALGLSVYSTVRFPEWLPTFLSRNILMSITLVLVLIGMVHLTVFVWRDYGLMPPHERIQQLVVDGLMRKL